MNDPFLNKMMLNEIKRTVEHMRNDLRETGLKDTSIDILDIDPETANTDELTAAQEWLREVYTTYFPSVKSVRERHPASFWDNVKVFGGVGLPEVRLLRNARKRLRAAYIDKDRPAILFKAKLGRKGLARDKAK